DVTSVMSTGPAKPGFRIAVIVGLRCLRESCCRKTNVRNHTSDDSSSLDVHTFKPSNRAVCAEGEVPSLVKEGWPRHQEKCREATLDGADGVVRSTSHNR